MFAPLAEQMAVGKAATCTKTSNSKSQWSAQSICDDVILVMQHTVILSPSLDLQVPSILSEELQYNLFMNLSSGGTGLKDALGLPHHTNNARVLAELRKQKNAYKPFD